MFLALKLFLLIFKRYTAKINVPNNSTWRGVTGDPTALRPCEVVSLLDVKDK